MGTFMEKCFDFYQVRKELEARISGLENEKAELSKENLAVKISRLKNSNDQLLQSKEKLTKERHKLVIEKENLAKANTKLKTEKENINNQLNASQKQVKELEQS